MSRWNLIATILLTATIGCGGKKEAENKPPSEPAPEVAKKPDDQPTKKDADEKKFQPKPLTRPRPLRDDPAALSTLEELNADLQFSKFGLIRSVTISNQKPEAVLEALIGLKDLRELTLDSLPLTDEQLSTLAGSRLAKSLESLSIKATKVTDKGAAVLGGFSKLERLNLSGTKITDEALSSIAGLSKLSELDLSWTKIQGKSFVRLAPMTQLHSLSIAFTDVEAESLDALKKIPSLKAIDVQGSAVLDVDDADKLAANFAGISLQGLTITELPEAKPESEQNAGDAPPKPAAQAFAVGDLAPEIDGQDIDGKPFKLSEYRGKVVLLDFWGHWCVHCRNLYPHAKKLVGQYKEQPFVMLGVNSDGDRELLQQIVKIEKLTWRSWFDGGPDGPIATAWKIRGWPTLVLIDHKGVIRHIGLRGKALDKALAELIQEAGGKVPTPEKDDSL